MTTIGSGIAGSIAATNLAGQARTQQTQAEQADEAAQSKFLKRIADIQEHEVEDTEQAELDIRPDERQRRRRKKNGSDDQNEPTDFVELSGSRPPQPALAAPVVGSVPPPVPQTPAARHVSETGGLLDIEA